MNQASVFQIFWVKEHSCRLMAMLIIIATVSINNIKTTLLKITCSCIHNNSPNIKTISNVLLSNNIIPDI